MKQRMKHSLGNITIIKPLSPQQQQSLARWFFFSCVIIIGTLLAIISISIPFIIQVITLRNSVNEWIEKTKNYQEINNHKNMLHQQATSLHNRKNTITQFVDNPHNPYNHIKTIMNACNATITLEQARIAKSSYEIIIFCTSLHHATELMQHLALDPYFSYAQLTALQHDISKGHFRCTIKGKKS